MLCYVMLLNVITGVVPSSAADSVIRMFIMIYLFVLDDSLTS